MCCKPYTLLLLYYNIIRYILVECWIQVENYFGWISRLPKGRLGVWGVRRRREKSFITFLLFIFVQDHIVLIDSNGNLPLQHPINKVTWFKSIKMKETYGIGSVSHFLRCIVLAWMLSLITFFNCVSMFALSSWVMLKIYLSSSLLQVLNARST